MKKSVENMEAKLFDNMRKLNPTFVKKQMLNEEEGEKKWIQGADMKKGALHDRLGIPEDEKIPISIINRHIAQLKKKSGGEKKLSADDSTFMKQLVAAKTMKKLDEGTLSGEQIYVVFDGTSHWIAPAHEYVPTDGEVVGEFTDIDLAQAKADELNDEAQGIGEGAPQQQQNDTYFETLSAALEAVRKRVEKKGYTLDEDAMNLQFGTGGISYGETKRANIPLFKDGVPAKNRSVTIAIYRMESGRYELTAYLN